MVKLKFRSYPKMYSLFSGEYSEPILFGLSSPNFYLKFSQLQSI